MEPRVILTLILAISTAAYLVDQILDLINLRAPRPDSPDELSGYFDPNQYQRSLAYHRERTRFAFVMSAVSFAVSFAMLLLGGFGWIDGQVALYVRHEIVQGLIFFGVIGLAGDLLSTPFQCYSNFVIEAKYGFNKSTPLIFITDKLKGYLLAVLIGGPVLALFFYMARYFGPHFWIWFSVVAIFLIWAVNTFYASLILPLFNKLTPLPNGALKEAIADFAARVSFPLDSVYVMDGSKRSSKANAFFSGMGRRKKIVLYDTLIESHSTEELVAVLAHEVGHYKKRHIVWSFLLASIQIVFTLFVLSLLLYAKNVSLALGGDHWSMPLNLVAFGILFSPISGITGLAMNIFSRRNEFEADRFARDTADGAALASALKRLSVDSLSDLYPHPVYVFFHYSHPPLLQRLKALTKPNP